MRIDIKIPNGAKYIHPININYCGYGAEDFREELIQGLIAVDTNTYNVPDPVGLVKKLKGTLSKENMGRFMHYVIVKGYPITIQVWR